MKYFLGFLVLVFVGCASLQAAEKPVAEPVTGEQEVVNHCPPDDFVLFVKKPIHVIKDDDGNDVMVIGVAKGVFDEGGVTLKQYQDWVQRQLEAQEDGEGEKADQ